MRWSMSDRDHQDILQLSWSLAGVATVTELEAAAAEALFTLIGGELTACNVVNVQQRSVYAIAFPAESASADFLEDIIQSILGDHPMVHHVSRWSPTVPLCMSHIVSRQKFIRTRTYELIFRPYGFEHQLMIPLRLNVSQKSGIAYGVNRCKRDFSESDQCRAYAVQPVLAALHAALAARQPSEEQLDVARATTRLTRRELEIITLMASGMTAAAIGHARRISSRTVRKHLENAYSKLGVHDRLQAVTYCRQIGLLS
jgi:DNA-binding CsgD family transcriptional regulator